jgi:hypothetical protein
MKLLKITGVDTKISVKTEESLLLLNNANGYNYDEVLRNVQDITAES